MNEQITEKTNNGEGVQGTGADNSAGASAAVVSSVATENQGANNATNVEGGANDGMSKAPSSTNEGEKGAENKAQKQNDSINKEMARKRREREEAKKLEEARIDAIKSVLSENPYTKKPIVDNSDVKEYLLMKQIEKDGKDPIADYPEYVKNQAREKAGKEAKEQATSEQITKDIEEFSAAHPGVDVKNLFNDENFNSFAEGKLGRKSLSEIYAAYLPIKEAIEGAKRDAEKKAHADAVAGAAVGSLTNASTPLDGEFFTKEQVLKMSRKEISDNYEKIRKSQEKW